MSKDAMIIDYKYCTGCHACEITCQNEKELPEGEWKKQKNIIQVQ